MQLDVEEIRARQTSQGFLKVISPKALNRGRFQRLHPFHHQTNSNENLASGKTKQNTDLLYINNQQL